MEERKIVYRIEEDMDREKVLCTTYRIKDLFRQFHDAMITPIDAMNFVMHAHLMKYLRKNYTIVEFCMGGGNLLQFIKRYAKDIKEYTGIDINPSAITWAETRVGYKEIDHKEFYPFPHKFITGNVAEADTYIPHKSADVLIYVSSLEHMHYDLGRKSLEAAFNILNSNGLMILTTPNAEVHDKPYKAHVYEWPRTQLLETLEDVGFTIEHEYGILANKGDLPNDGYMKELKEYLPYEWIGACLAGPFPEKSKEVLLVCRKRVDRSLFEYA